VPSATPLMKSLYDTFQPNNLTAPDNLEELEQLVLTGPNWSLGILKEYQFDRTQEGGAWRLGDESRLTVINSKTLCRINTLNVSTRTTGPNWS
jgi:hypothetical protein